MWCPFPVARSIPASPYPPSLSLSALFPARPSSKATSPFTHNSLSRPNCLLSPFSSSTFNSLPLDAIPTTRPTDGLRVNERAHSCLAASAPSLRRGAFSRSRHPFKVSAGLCPLGACASLAAAPAVAVAVAGAWVFLVDAASEVFPPLPLTTLAVASLWRQNVRYQTTQQKSTLISPDPPSVDSASSGPYVPRTREGP